MATTGSVAAALEQRVELQVQPAGPFMLLAARGAAPRPSRCSRRLKEQRTRQPVGRLTSDLKCNTATIMTCVGIEEWTDGDDVRRRAVFLEFHGFVTI